MPSSFLLRCMTSASFALPSLERCDRPTAASFSASMVQPGRFAHGPDEKQGLFGLDDGFIVFLLYPILDASRVRPLDKLSNWSMLGGCRKRHVGSGFTACGPAFQRVQPAGRPALRTDRDNDYDKPTVFGCTPDACAPGNYCAHDRFDLLRSWLATCFRGRAR